MAATAGGTSKRMLYVGRCPCQDGDDTTMALVGVVGLRRVVSAHSFQFHHVRAGWGDVGGLAEEVDEKVLHAAFIPFGEVVDVQIPQDYATRACRQSSSALVCNTCRLPMSSTCAHSNRTTCLFPIVPCRARTCTPNTTSSQDTSRARP